MLVRELGDWPRSEVIDTLKLARQLLPAQPSYKLGVLVEPFHLADGLPADLAPHRAAYDAMGTVAVLARGGAGNSGPA